MPSVAYIISWNIWQMDGLKYGLPGYNPYIVNSMEKNPNQTSLFDNEDFFIEKDNTRAVKPHEKLCLIKDFFMG